MIHPSTPNPLPRELAPGVFWLGECRVNAAGGRETHGYNSVYAVAGERHSALVDGGITTSNPVILAQFESLAAELPPPRYIFVTHSEMAHASAVGHMLARYPELTVHGDVSDLHLVFPQFADRFHFAEPGDRFDLGGTEIVVVESVFRDLVHSRWYYDTTRRVLFTGDGFAYTHFHEDGACGHLAEESATLDIGTGMARFAEAAFHWTRFVDVEPYIARLEWLIFEELGAELIAPAHGVPIGDPAATMPEVNAGLRQIPKLT
jgi:flavorubredoxin